MSHDTTRWSFKEPCSDCGETGSSFRHTGGMVPGGQVGYFCLFCWQQRLDDQEKGRPPRPLGTKPPGVPKEFTEKAITVTTRTGSVYQFSAPNEKGERSVSCETKTIGFDTCKVMDLSVGRELWFRSSGPVETTPLFWATTPVVSITMTDGGLS